MIENYATRGIERGQEGFEWGGSRCWWEQRVLESLEGGLSLGGEKVKGKGEEYPLLAKRSIKEGEQACYVGRGGMGL